MLEDAPSTAKPRLTRAAARNVRAFLVHPAPRPEEHVPLTHKWSHGPGAILGLAAEAEKNAREMLNASSATTGPFYGFDGPVAEPSEWAFVKVPPGVEMMYHTAGEGYKKAVADAS